MTSSPTISATSSPPWSDLVPELLGRVIAHLHFPGDCARFRAVCRAWHTAAREHVARRQLPWIVLPEGSFCTIGDGAAFHRRIPGLPRDATCLGATGDDWLALDCTDDVLRRTRLRDKFRVDGFVTPRHDVKHRHAYSLHNPFSGETVALPELDSIVGDVAETFEIRKVLARSNSPDAVVAVATNNWHYPIILCRPGKGRCVVPHLYVFDVVFFGGDLYGIDRDDNLVVFNLAEDNNGRPIVTKYKRVIRHPLAEGEEDLWSWMDHYTYTDDYDEALSSNNEDDDNEDGDVSNDDELNQEEGDSFNGDGLVPDGKVEEEDEEEDDEDDFNGYGLVPDGRVIIQDKETPDEAKETPDEAKDVITITTYLVESCGEELLLVKHHVQTPSSWCNKPYTRKIEVFKADIDAGKWTPVTAGGLAEGEALFLSRSFCKSIRAYGDIKEGFIYFVDTDDVFDTISWTRRPLFSLPPQRYMVSEQLLTWLFPADLVI